MPITVAVQKPVVQLPPTAMSMSPIYLPADPGLIKDADFVYLSTGTKAEGFFLIGGTFVIGDTITYSVNGVVRPAIAVVNNEDALAKIVADINANSVAELVTASIDGNLVIIIANNPGVAGNAITLAISTTSVTGEVAPSGATLVGGSALGLPGRISSAPANVAGGLVGVAQCSSEMTWQGNPTVGKAYPDSVFGQSNVGTGLFSAMPGQIPVLTLGPPNVVVMNLTPSTGWQAGGTQQATYGTLIGLAIDAATGYYIADPTATNIVAVIQNVDNSVNNALVNNQYELDPTGILGIRVYVAFLASALAIVQGV
jgi:hypothetical protein